MVRFTVAEIVQATQGELVSGRRDSGVVGVSIDSRTIRKGELYVAIIGKNLDGHAFVAEALAKGAGAVVISQRVGSGDEDRATVVRVRDTTQALGDIAAWHRRRFDPWVVGITGSNGKSTTKEMLAAILSRRYRVLKPPSSFNNDIGVPLTVLAMNRLTQAAIIEMEMNLIGGISRLCEIAQPHVAVVTNIGDTHLEFLGSRDGVAREKSELLEYVNRNGAAVVNADDPVLARLVRRYPARELATFALRVPADVFATDVKDQGLRGSRFRLNGLFPVRLRVVGVHNVYNALAAVAAAQFLGVPAREAVAGLESYSGLELRLQACRLAGMTLLEDCYNANPQSMAAALAALSRLGPGRKVAVLGDMHELGPAATRFHCALGRRAAEVADIVVARGSFAPRIARGALQAGLPRQRVIACADNLETVQKLIDILRSGDRILVKGSRANRMEEILRELKRYYATQD
jgi:UDP-N-acetylmuramoyl-tripeptide--D-alanyl-D-alanine ligase